MKHPVIWTDSKRPLPAAGGFAGGGTEPPNRDPPTVKPIYHSPAVELLCCRLEHLQRWPVATLSAPFWRFYWNRDPGAWIEFAEQRYDLLPGDFFLLPPYTPAAARLDRPVDHLYLHFSTREPYAGVPPEIFHFPLTGDIQDLVTQLTRGIHQQREDNQHFRLKALALVHLALTRIPADRLQPHRTDDRIERVLEYITVRLGRKLTNRQLAGIAGMHTNAFTRRFRQVTGMSPQRYMNVKRIERACTILHNAAVSIEAVADTLGFCDRYHFSRVFKQVQGMGPAAFRRMVSGG